MPTTSPFYSSTLGIDKAAVVRSLQALGKTVAYAGDGFPDAEPARLVPDHLCFARGDLATVLAGEGRSFRSYSRWSEIAAMLLEGARK